MNAPVQDAGLHIFSLVVRDRPGVLVRIALVFSRRGFNIESLAVSPGRAAGFSRMTIVSRGAPATVDQIHKQLAKLIDVAFVTNHPEESPIETEIALLKVRLQSAEHRNNVLALANQHNAHALDETDGRLVLLAHGTSAELDSLIAKIRLDDLEEVLRSGKIVMDRGASHFSHLLGAG